MSEQLSRSPATSQTHDKSKTITIAGGHQFRSSVVGTETVLVGNIGGATVIIHGPNKADIDWGSALGGLGDGLLAALKGLVGILKSMSCTPKTTVSQTFDSSGHMTGQTITTTCEPS